jgi:hypothetical protein
VVIDRVYEHYPAHEAGLRPGDVLVEVRGKRFDGLDAPDGASRAEAIMRNVQQTVRALFPGEKLPLTVVRDGRVLAMEIEVAAASERDQAHIDVEELFGIVLDSEGDVPRVQSVLDNSWLGRIGGARRLQGMRIVEVLGRRVKDLDDLAAAAAEVRSFLLKSNAGNLRVAVWFEDQKGQLVRLVLPVSAQS